MPVFIYKSACLQAGAFFVAIFVLSLVLLVARGEVLAGLRFFDDKACALFVYQTVAVTAERFAKFFIDLYIVLYKINTVIASLF